MINPEKYQRQFDLINQEMLNTPITIIGAGGIGSWTTLALAKMGCENMTVYDGDEVEIVNTASQLYGERSIGSNKAKALTEIVKDLTGVLVNPLPKFWEGEDIDTEIIISGLDSMQARTKLWSRIKDLTRGLYVDGRMSGDIIHLYIVKLEDEAVKREYEAGLSLPVEPEACTSKAVAYNTSIIGGMIGNIIKHYIKSEALPKDIVIDLFNFDISCQIT